MRGFPGVLALPDEWRARRRVRLERVAPSEHAQWEPPRCRPDPSRTGMARYATVRFLDARYSGIDVAEVTRPYDTVQPKKAVRQRRKDVRKALHRISLKALMKFCDQVGEEYRIRPDHFARKVVGVGSVGTEAFVLLLGDRADEPLFLQLKEQKEPVLAAYADPREYQHQGEPVSKGRRMTQAATDEFLGWATGIAAAHADQNAKGYQRLMDAVMDGRVQAVTGLSGTNPQPRLTGPLLPRAVRQGTAGPGPAGPAVRAPAAQPLSWA
jgi:Uncharacterized protein conserved in bacteria (DUF2252)